MQPVWTSNCWLQLSRQVCLLAFLSSISFLGSNQRFCSVCRFYPRKICTSWVKVGRTDGHLARENQDKSTTTTIRQLQTSSYTSNQKPNGRADGRPRDVSPTYPPP
ncbi:hypothetical protein IWX46DRAFT_102143 [Phyllosticta citricarpa]|uniref:Secreted protein n=1 Tax=Phyllosticta citricarpa TaxID=55181 RepID=A0ABR1MBY5_9PEZI